MSVIVECRSELLPLFLEFLAPLAIIRSSLITPLPVVAQNSFVWLVLGMLVLIRPQFTWKLLNGLFSPIPTGKFFHAKGF
jgi:hypothetical protein